MFFQSLLIGIVGVVLWYIWRKVSRKQNPSTKNSQKNVRSVGFVHLDLGVGGAERLVVDFALAVQRRGHHVEIYTSNHPKHHCFPETLTELKVKVFGNWIPHHISGGFQLICSWIRIIWVSFMLVSERKNWDVIFCDGVSVCVPILKLSGAKVMFYCHFPDKLLTRKKSGIRTLYRLPLDWSEEVTTNMADKTLVNSKFTRSVFQTHFPSIFTIPEVVYPCVDLAAFQNLFKNAKQNPKMKIPSDVDLIVSLNRFDPSKKVENGLDGFLGLLKRLQSNPLPRKPVLVIAGGYEPSVALNTEYLSLLQQKIPKEVAHFVLWEWEESRRNEWDTHNASIVFLPNVSESQKAELFIRSKVVMYTPDAEHFGIVPLEVMLSGGGVLVGVAGGGVKETLGEDFVIKNEKMEVKDHTSIRGVAVAPPGDPKDYSVALHYVLDPANQDTVSRMKKNAIEFVQNTFSSKSIEENMHKIILELSP